MMLLRSQDKSKLVPFNSMLEVHPSENNDSCNIYLAGVGTMGQYVDMDEALRVMQMIESFYGDVDKWDKAFAFPLAGFSKVAQVEPLKAQATVLDGWQGVPPLRKWDK